MPQRPAEERARGTNLAFTTKSYYGYREYKVVAGDTLWSIAQANYGDGALYPRIGRANPAQITDPDETYPGWVLRIPIGS